MIRGQQPRRLPESTQQVERVAEVLGVGASRARDVIRESQKELSACRRGRQRYVPPEGLAAWQRGPRREYRNHRKGGDCGEVDLSEIGIVIHP